jgi:hypothetical protein
VYESRREETSTDVGGGIGLKKVGFHRASVTVRQRLAGAMVLNTDNARRADCLGL